jgi:hypothetical protein
MQKQTRSLEAQQKRNCVRYTAEGWRVSRKIATCTPKHDKKSLVLDVDFISYITNDEAKLFKSIFAFYSKELTEL